jgi:hypothetical protein
LTEVVAEAREAGLAEEELDARLAQGVIELERGDASAGRALLARLGAEAHKRGFDAIAAQATRHTHAPRGR